MISGKLTFQNGKLVKARLQPTYPLAKPVGSCLSRLLTDFFKALIFLGESDWQIVKKLDQNGVIYLIIMNYIYFLRIETLKF